MGMGPFPVFLIEMMHICSQHKILVLMQVINLVSNDRDRMITCFNNMAREISTNMQKQQIMKLYIDRRLLWWNTQEMLKKQTTTYLQPWRNVTLRFTFSREIAQTELWRESTIHCKKHAILLQMSEIIALFHNENPISPAKIEK